MGWVRTGPPGRGIWAATRSQGCASLPLGYSRPLPPGAIDLRDDSDSGAAHAQDAFLASSGFTRSRSSLDGLK